MTRIGMVFFLPIAACCVACFAVGAWIQAIVILVALILVVGGDKDLRSTRARRDLREVYPPKRDRFHRDLERLNRMRSAPVRYEELTGLQPRPRRVAKQQEKWYWDRSSRSWKPHPVPKSLQKRQRSGDVVDHIYVAILEGIRDSLVFMAPFLVVILFGAVVGLVVSLL
jgi:hypothetical protein